MRIRVATPHFFVQNRVVRTLRKNSNRDKDWNIRHPSRFNNQFRMVSSWRWICVLRRTYVWQPRDVAWANTRRALRQRWASGSTTASTSRSTCCIFSFIIGCSCPRLSLIQNPLNRCLGTPGSCPLMTSSHQQGPLQHQEYSSSGNQRTSLFLL